MEDRRKSKRIELMSTLIIKGLGDAADQEVAIAVVDVSKTGVGFVCINPLTVGTVYEAHLTIWTKEVLTAFLKVVRMDKIDEDQYSYGAVFIGMPDVDVNRIAIYDTIDSFKK